MSPTDRSLDMVAMTHIYGDHSRGLLEVLDRYDVATVVVGDNPMDDQSSLEWQARLDRKHIDPVEVSAGQVLEVEPGVTLEVLNPVAVPFIGSGADRNNNAVVRVSSTAACLSCWLRTSKHSPKTTWCAPPSFWRASYLRQPTTVAALLPSRLSWAR